MLPNFFCTGNILTAEVGNVKVTTSEPTATGGRTKKLSGFLGFRSVETFNFAAVKGVIVFITLENSVNGRFGNILGVRASGTTVAVSGASIDTLKNNRPAQGTTLPTNTALKKDILGTKIFFGVGTRRIF